MFANDDSYPYRVFLSYAQHDAPNAHRLVDRLHDLQLQPVWDQHNPGGWPFVDEIKNQIDHCHLLVLLLTPQSVSSTWVNHEIGYAMGRNIPVLPLSLGPLPAGMAVGIQAEIAKDLEDLLSRVDRPRINRLVANAQTVALYECADLSETRTEAIIEHCAKVDGLSCKRHKPMRHRAAFGSFSLPSNPDDPIWNDRYDDRTPSRNRNELLSIERNALEAYVKLFGCDLMLYPSLPGELSERATQARIKVLIAFLEEMRRARAPVRVAFDERALSENLIILGDWFFVESLTPRPEGFRHTTITCHAPTVLKRIEEFDWQFSSCCLLSPDSAIQCLKDNSWRSELPK
jgi:hypothetical protein